MARALLIKAAADLAVALRARAGKTPANGRANGFDREAKETNSPSNAARLENKMGNEIEKTRRGELEHVTKIDGDSGYISGKTNAQTWEAKTEQRMHQFGTRVNETTVGEVIKHRKHGDAAVGTRSSPLQGQDCYTV